MRQAFDIHLEPVLLCRQKASIPGKRKASTLFTPRKKQKTADGTAAHEGTPAPEDQADDDDDPDAPYETVDEAIGRAKAEKSNPRATHPTKLDRVFDNDYRIVNGMYAKADDEDIFWPNGHLVTYVPKHSILADNKKQFRYLIIDEAHVMRRTSSTWHQVCRHMLAQSVVFVSGTFLMSSLRDLVSPLDIIWDHQGIDLDMQAILRLPDLHELWNDDYDPYNERNGIFHLYFIAANESSNAALRYLDDTMRNDDIRLWHFCPVLYHYAGSKAKWSTSFARDIANKGMRAISRRRTLNTRLRPAETGITTWPGQGLKPMLIRTEELFCSADWQSMSRRAG